MDKTKQDIKVVYKMQYAIKMKILGHKILTTLPNPANDKLECWVFENDQTFDFDLQKLIQEGRKKNG